MTVLFGIDKKIKETKRLVDLYNKGQRFVVFDVETLQGRGKENQYIVEVGAVEAGKHFSKEYKTFQRIMKHDTNNWNQYFHSLQVHKIPREKIVSGEDRELVMQDFLKFIEGSILITHSSVDVRAMNLEITRHSEWSEEWSKLEIWDSYIDSLKVARELLPGKGIKRGVSDLARRYNVINKNAHRALDDSITTKKIVGHLIKEAFRNGY